MISARSRILHLVEQGLLDPKDTEAAMEAAGLLPGEREAYRFAERLLLGLGVLAVALGVVFFVAYNWDALGKAGKFALVEGALVLSLLPLLRYDPDSRVGGFSLLGAAILVGALLALFGQIYQTGADPWQLFAAWGALILPWAVLGRFEPLWILWIGIVNVAIVLYFSLFPFLFFPGTKSTALALILFNGLALILWERHLSASPGKRGLGPRIAATLTGAAATLLAIDAIFSSHFFHGNAQSGGVIWVMVWIVWIIVHCRIYRDHIRDLYMLAGGCLSLFVVGIAFLGRMIVKFRLYEAGGFSLMTVAMLLAGWGIAHWLRETLRSWEEENG